MSLARRVARSNGKVPRGTRRRRRFLLVYRRGGWQLSSANRYRWFSSLLEVASFFDVLRSRRAAGPIQARLEEVSDTGERRELPLTDCWEALDAEEGSR